MTDYDVRESQIKVYKTNFLCFLKFVFGASLGVIQIDCAGHILVHMTINTKWIMEW